MTECGFQLKNQSYNFDIPFLSCFFLLLDATKGPIDINRLRSICSYVILCLHYATNLNISALLIELFYKTFSITSSAQLKNVLSKVFVEYNDWFMVNRLAGSS